MADTETGTPVPLLDLTAQHRAIAGEVEEAMAGVVESQRFILGPPVEALEEAVAEYVGAAHAVGCASGTDALLLPLRALGAEPGDEVVVPAFTFFATAGAVWNAGLRPAFCDVDPETFNVTPATMERALTDRTRAAIPVHLFGQMARMEAIGPWAVRRRLFILEDAAQSIGARRTVEGPEGQRDLRAGSAGDACAFSFFPTKNLGGYGDGGMVTTNDPDVADAVRRLRVHGGEKMYRHEVVGTNSRLDALHAAVLRAKLPHLDRWAEARRRNAALYDEVLADVDGVRTPAVDPGNVHVHNQYTIRAERRDRLRERLRERRIGTGIYYPVPLHLQPCFEELGYREGDLPVSERLAREVLSLPVFPELGRERLERVVDAIRDFYGA